MSRYLVCPRPYSKLIYLTNLNTRMREKESYLTASSLSLSLSFRRSVSLSIWPFSRLSPLCCLALFSKLFVNFSSGRGGAAASTRKSIPLMGQLSHIKAQILRVQIQLNYPAHDYSESWYLVCIGKVMTFGKVNDGNVINATNISRKYFRVWLVSEFVITPDLRSQRASYWGQRGTRRLQFKEIKTHCEQMETAWTGGITEARKDLDSIMEEEDTGREKGLFSFLQFSLLFSSVMYDANIQSRKNQRYI